MHLLQPMRSRQLHLEMQMQAAIIVEEPMAQVDLERVASQKGFRVLRVRGKTD